MRHVMRRTIEIVVLAIISFHMWGGAIAEAGPLDASLRGDYDVEVTRSCAVANSPVTFSPADFQSVGGSATIFPPTGVKGTIHFNGDGTGDSSLQTMSVVSSGASRTTQTCSVSYTVNSDGTFGLQQNCNLTFVGGPLDGQTATLNGIGLDGRISLDATVLIISDTTPSIEVFNNPTGPVTNQRVCNSHGVATSRR